MPQSAFYTFFSQWLFASSVPASIPRLDGDANVTEATEMPGKAGAQWN